MAEYEVLKSFKGSPDGKSAVQYEKGEVVPLTDSLAETALAEKWVKQAPEKKAESDAEKGKEKAETKPAARD